MILRAAAGVVNAQRDYSRSVQLQRKIPVRVDAAAEPALAAPRTSGECRDELPESLAPYRASGGDTSVARFIPQNRVPAGHVVGL